MRRRTGRRNKIMMNYDDFIEYVKDNILGNLPDAYREFEVSVSKTMKNNGLELDGLMIRGREDIAPVIYLNGYYEKYNDGYSLEQIMSEISETYETNLKYKGFPGDLAETLRSFDEIKGDIFSKVVNTENNKALLDDRPHTEFEDLSITYHIMISRDSSGIASAPITNLMAAEYGVTAEELDRIAKENMSRNNPMVFQSMYEIMKEMLAPDVMRQDMDKDMADALFDDMFPSGGDPMYVLSNESKVNGAIWMTSEEALDSISEKIGGDFFLLPSSIHECIIVPRDGFDERELQSLVKEVNSTQVSREDRLSDNVYSYDSKEHKLTLATGDKTHEETHDHNMELEENKKHSSMKY